MTDLRRPIPDQLRVEFERIASRAAAAGRPLDPVPVLEVAARSSHGSRSFVGPSGSTEPARVQLGLDLLETAPADRAWTIAHELSHVLRRQEGTRLEYTHGPLTLAAVLLVVSVSAVLLAVLSLLRGAGGDVGLPFGVAAVSAVGMYFVNVTLERREEIATDATAAEVFAEVLSVAGVERVRRNEGALSRYLPTVIRSHPHPAARRRAGLAHRPLTKRPSPPRGPSRGAADPDGGLQPER